MAYYFTTINSVATIDGNWYIVLSGAIAICAMILPGISGAFILLLLGSYDKVLGAINDKDILTIALFGLGCVIGLFSFARLLKFLFGRFKNITVAVLAGFMIGSLNKVWPWKETISTRLNSHNESVPFIQENVLPANFSGEPQLIYAIVLACIGFLGIVLLEKFSSKKSR